MAKLNINGKVRDVQAEPDTPPQMVMMVSYGSANPGSASSTIAPSSANACTAFAVAASTSGWSFFT